LVRPRGQREVLQHQVTTRQLREEHLVDRADSRLRRRGLRTEADKFTKGDLGDPTAIHGDQMPVVEKLAQAADRITVTYAELPDGATLTYDTTDRELVAALHAWFDAQVSDHGRHAEASG
jgi:hypothetical protein